MTDRQTDRQTDRHIRTPHVHDDIGLACIASRGKNGYSNSYDTFGSGGSQIVAVDFDTI